MPPPMSGGGIFYGKMFVGLGIYVYICEPLD